MNNDLWNNFIHTGSVEDYLKYRESEENTKADLTNANNNQGLNNQRADYRGE
ncbi:MAG: hypothetical protein ACLUFN_09765 [Eubacterium sp.]